MRQESLEEIENKKNRYGLISVVIVLVIIGLIIFWQPIINQMHAWKLLPQPEKLTELYFNNPNSLPTTYSPNETQNVDFTVHNLEYQTIKYTYTINESAKVGQTGTILKTGTFTLNQNQYQKESDIISILPISNRVNISINLTSQNEDIDYWLTKSGTK